ncbi:hypothetical protein HPB51_016766 [Rhipicephalus microplus]|uniref:THAP-type domain-containing protein n=1 Tax=Rhipicephalus microplus TaxID=6941 RepID=A0A9J6DAS4_RHIMP|nr:hypothetical protein HPB51_016766 [Rhipicephalus microplus]
MPCCCAFGCRNRTEDGKKLFCIPRGKQNLTRRKVWLHRIGRKVFEPSATARLCEDHFTEDQFEPIILKNTGEKKLRKFATPSIFLHRPDAKPRKPPPKRTIVESTDDPKVKQNTQVDVEPQPVDTENDVPDMQLDLRIPAPFQPESTQTVRELGQPLSKERSLHRHLEGYMFTPGLLEDIMASLALKALFLEKYNFKFLLLSRFGQDALENHFSTRRCKNPVPRVLEFKFSLRAATMAQFLRPSKDGSYTEEDCFLLTGMADDNKPNESKMDSGWDAKQQLRTHAIGVLDSRLVGVVGLLLPTLPFGFPGSRLVGVAGATSPLANAVGFANACNAGDGRVRPNSLGGCFGGRRGVVFRRPLHRR